MAENSDLETARALGKFTALFQSLNDRFDRYETYISGLSAERQSQLNEMQRDMQEQRLTLTAFDERMKAHIAAHDLSRQSIITEIHANRDLAKSNLDAARATMAYELAGYREHTAVEAKQFQDTTITDIRNLKALASDNKAQLQSLVAWRSKILGAAALVSVLLALFGRPILAWAMSQWAG